MVNHTRVACVWSEQAGRTGSGYVIRCQRGDLIFTAAHVVAGIERCQVRLHGGETWLGATVCWRDDIADVAVLLLDEPLTADLGDEPDWATCRNADVECSAIGYPRFQRRDGRADTEEFKGRLRAGSGLESKRLNLPHSASARPDDDWKGMSGAALFADGLLIGVITHADNDRLL
ncbi:MAG: trypsin-like peptidase domain-containing protein, partial [Myxococcales bacterium]|nr:trypsin-like peptidase domain-containing protein [Myxococcales bacterium]